MKPRYLLCLLLALLMVLSAACAPPAEDGGDNAEVGNGAQNNDSNSSQNGGNGAQNNDSNSSQNGGNGAQNNDSNSSQNGAGSEEDEGLNKTYRILFIGNSYTFYSDMPTALFEPLAEAAGYTLEVKSITNGYHTLEQFADPSDAFGAQVEDALANDEPYDFVILQEQSIRPATKDNAFRFYAAVRNLTERIRATGAEPVLYATWGRKTGSDTLDAYGWTSKEMTWRLAAGYQAIADELSLRVAHVGLAFLENQRALSGIELYAPDLSHPSYAGSYLAAATLFAEIFEKDPYYADFYGTLPEEEALMLCESAYTAATTPDIPEDYLTCSVGK